MFLKQIRKFIMGPTKTVVIEDAEKIEVTDEIEKSLWEIKQRYDFDTAEISDVIEDYKNRKARHTKSKECVDEKQ
jgi:ABC-type uncharacterized transport system substrate-binding protein